MDKQQQAKNGQYYTDDHEWIDFQGAVAYIGVSSFKLIGFRAIQQVIFNDKLGIKKRGDLITTIKYNDYTIKLHMPVDGKLLEMNTNLIYGDDNFLLQYAESMWIAKIEPLLPNERKHLLLPRQYQSKGRNKYAK